MTSNVLLDAGPLVAYLDQRDQHHHWAVRQFGQIAIPPFSCEAVLTEACFLLRHLPNVVATLNGYLDRGIIRIEFRIQTSHARVFALMRKYHDVPMSLADACLVSMAEDVPGSQVFTTDSDFNIYRLHGRKPVGLIALTVR